MPVVLLPCSRKPLLGGPFPCLPRGNAIRTANSYKPKGTPLWQILPGAKKGGKKNPMQVNHFVRWWSRFACLKPQGTQQLLRFYKRVCQSFLFCFQFMLSTMSGLISSIFKMSFLTLKGKVRLTIFHSLVRRRVRKTLLNNIIVGLLNNVHYYMFGEKEKLKTT